MRFIAALISTLLIGCSAEKPQNPPVAVTTTSSPGLRSFKGYYISGFERSEFRPESNLGKRWWLSGAIEGCPFLDFDQERYSPWRQTYLELQGILSPSGHYGHLGAYERELTIVKMISCRPPREGEGVEP